METSDISNKITFQDCRNGDTSDVVTVHNTEQQNSQNSQPEQVIRNILQLYDGICSK